MLTCSQIHTRITHFDQPITDENYQQIAACIHPPCEWHDAHDQKQIVRSSTLQAIYRNLEQLPEVIEAKRALGFQTPDFADLAIRFVTLWQANAAKMRYWLNNVVAPNLDDDPQMSPERDVDDQSFDHQAIADFIQLTRRQRRFRHVLVVGRPRIIGSTPSPVAEPRKPPAASQYQLSVQLTSGETPLFQTTIHTNNRHSLTNTYTKLVAALNEDAWIFAIDRERDLKETTPAQPTSQSKTPAPVNGNSNTDPTTDDPTANPQFIPF